MSLTVIIGLMNLRPLSGQEGHPVRRPSVNDKSMITDSSEASMRLHEILGIEQNRSWGVCSLNEFRKARTLFSYFPFLLTVFYGSSS